MHSAFWLPLAAGLAVDAAVLQARGCSLHLTASGSISGPIGQRDSGQTVEGDGIEATSFTLNDGKLTDSKGRGCFFTGPSTVLQCDPGATPADGFSIDCHGTVSFKGDSTFWECDAEDGVYNIYKEPNGSNCGKITLTADGCHDECKTAPSSSCPNDLSGDYQFPHLIIPVDSEKPDQASGTSYFGEVSSSVSSIFNFDIPQSYDGKTCNLVFLFPKQDQLETSSFTFTGSGQIDFSHLDEAASQETSYENAPGVKKDYGTTTVAPGNGYDIAKFDCPAGEAIAFEMSGPDGCDTNLRWFQDFNPCPIGLYITVS